MTSADRKYIRLWYWSGALLVFIILVIGGITRLTQSGLSMVEWRPIMGIIPPLTEEAWQKVFDQYRQFPEYQQLNRGMELSEFKFIFFWEYLHRMAGRLIGLVFLIPFTWFVVKRKFSSRQLVRALTLLALGLGQALMGWYMVQSGLIDQPYVSPYRLAAHLVLAFIIFGCCIWFALDLYPERRGIRMKHSPYLKRILAVFIGILILQVIWGAFVAGHHAGHVYNTFPKMNQFWIPPETWMLEPLIRNFFENVAAVQWIHRVLGTLLGVMGIYIWAKAFFSEPSRRLTWWGVVLLAVLLLQYLLGVYTLLYHVPLVLAVLHQAMALVLFGVALALYHTLRKGELSASLRP